jgi:hypothetical protein
LPSVGDGFEPIVALYSAKYKLSAPENELSRWCIHDSLTQIELMSDGSSYYTFPFPKVQVVVMFTGRSLLVLDHDCSAFGPPHFGCNFHEALA